jgi:acetolactate decarboxylase
MHSILNNIVLSIVFLSSSLAFARSSKELVQVSSIDALSRGKYAGIYALKDLRRYGNFGLGTFDGLDGEMVILDNRVYQITADGKVHVANNKVTVPFLATTFFEADKKIIFKKRVNKEGFQEYLDSLRLQPDHFYAIKVKGLFHHLKTRSVPPQQVPYPPLLEVVKHQQKTFDFKDVQGTMVGFWSPSYASGMNVAGYHFHFLTEDRQAGGHVLDFTPEEVLIEIEELTAFRALLA